MRCVRCIARSLPSTNRSIDDDHSTIHPLLSPRLIHKTIPNPQVRLEASYLTAAWEVTPTGKRPIPLSLRPPSSSGSAWELLLAASPLPPSLLLLAAGLAVVLLGVTLVALSGLAGKGNAAAKNE